MLSIWLSTMYSSVQSKVRSSTNRMLLRVTLMLLGKIKHESMILQVLLKIPPLYFNIKYISLMFERLFLKLVFAFIDLVFELFVVQCSNLIRFIIKCKEYKIPKEAQIGKFTSLPTVFSMRIAEIFLCLIKCNSWYLFKV